MVSSVGRLHRAVVVAFSVLVGEAYPGLFSYVRYNIIEPTSERHFHGYVPAIYCLMDEDPFISSVVLTRYYTWLVK